MINVTVAAASKITELLAEENKPDAGLRVFVQGGGCSGFQYGLMIDEGEGDATTDSVIESNGVKLLVDPISARYLSRRRSRLRRQHHRRRLHDQEPEREVDLRLRLVVQRCNRPARPSPRGERGRSLPGWTPPPPTSTACGPPAASAPASATSSSTSSSGRRDTSRPRISSTLIRREDPADQPGDHLPHAAVDGRRRDRAQGRFRRRPIPLRAFLPPSPALPSHLQELQSLLRVPQLGHRGAASRKWRRRAVSPPRRACSRFTAPARRAGPDAPRSLKEARTELLFARDALRIAIATERSGLEFYTRAAKDHARRARPARLREARRGRKRASRHARSAIPGAARSRIRSSSRGRRSSSSRERRTACSPPAPNSSQQGVDDRAGPDDRHPAASAGRTASSSATANGSRTPKARRSSWSSPTRSARTSSC